MGRDRKLVVEQKGKWAPAEDSLALNEVQERAGTSPPATWVHGPLAGSGRIASRIRNIRADAYEEYLGDLNTWATWTRTK